MAQVIRRLPHEASASLGNFFDAITIYLKQSVGHSNEVQLALKKAALMQTGLYQLNLNARFVFLRYIASILLTYEQKFKQRKPCPRQAGAEPPRFKEPVPQLNGTLAITP